MNTLKNEKNTHYDQTNNALTIQRLVSRDTYAAVFRYYDGHKLSSVELGKYNVKTSIAINRTGKKTTKKTLSVALIEGCKLVSSYGLYELDLDQQNELINMILTHGLGKIPKGQKIEIVAVLENDTSIIEKNDTLYKESQELIESELDSSEQSNARKVVTPGKRLH